MSEYYIRKLEPAELRGFYTRIENDFASGEYPPQYVLDKHIKEGTQEGFVLCDGTIDLAYSFCASSSANGYVLITLFAVFQEYRGQGIGSTFLQELQKKYAHKQAIIVEVERPELSQTPEQRDDRRRRIAFYDKEGYSLIKGVDYSIWDIPMYLMARSLNVSNEMITIEIEPIMHQIYSRLLGERFIHMMEFKKSLDGEKQ